MSTVRTREARQCLSWNPFLTAELRRGTHTAVALGDVLVAQGRGAVCAILVLRMRTFHGLAIGASPWMSPSQPKGPKTERRRMGSS